MQPASTSNGGICFDYIHGQCNRGDACRFSHDLKAISQESREERGICFDFTRGTCSRGELCRFSHNINVVGIAPGGSAAQEQAQALAKSAGVCFDFMKGICHRGPACRFSHDLSLLQSVEALKKMEGEGAKGLCYDFVKGQCTRGRSCKFSHDTTLPEITAGILHVGGASAGASTGLNHVSVDGLHLPPVQGSQLAGVMVPEPHADYAAVAAGRYVSPASANVSAPSSYSSDGLVVGSPNIGYAAVASGKGAVGARTYVAMPGQAHGMASGATNGNGNEKGMLAWDRRHLQDGSSQYTKGIQMRPSSVPNGQGWHVAGTRATNLGYEAGYEQLDHLTGDLRGLQLGDSQLGGGQNGLPIPTNGWREAVQSVGGGGMVKGTIGGGTRSLPTGGNVQGPLSPSPQEKQDARAFADSAFKWDSLFASEGIAPGTGSGLNLGAGGNDPYSARIGDTSNSPYGATLYSGWSGGYSMG